MSLRFSKKIFLSTLLSLGMHSAQAQMIPTPHAHPNLQALQTSNFNSEQARSFNVFSDGQATFTFNTIVPGSGNQQYNIDVVLNTRLLGMALSPTFRPCSPNADRDAACAVLLPIDVRVRTILQPDGSAPAGTPSLQDLRVGSVNILARAAGLSLQGTSYLVHHYDLDVGQFRGFEILGIKFDRAIRLGTQQVQFVLHGTASFGLGSFRSQRQALQFLATRHSYEPIEEGAAGYVFDVGGRIGVRFFRHILVDLFGGLNYAEAGLRTYFRDPMPTPAPRDMAVAPTPFDGSNSLMQRTIGAGLRVQVLPGVEVYGDVRQDNYSLDYQIQTRTVDPMTTVQTTGMERTSESFSPRSINAGLVILW